MHGQISWHELTTPNIKEAQAFYSGLLGWTFDGFGPDGKYWLIQNNEVAVGGLMPKTEETAFPQGWLFYVDVRDVDQAIVTATKLGGKSLLPPFNMPGVGRIGVIQDAAGATVGIMTSEDSSESPMMRPKTGEFCWRTLMTNYTEDGAKFYREVFGWEVQALNTGEEKPAKTFVWRGVPVAALDELPDHIKAPPHWGMAVAVDDCAKSAGRVEKLGGRLLMKPTVLGKMGVNAVLMDVSGAAFLSLFQADISAMDKLAIKLGAPA